MQIFKVISRKDGYSVVVAIVLGLMLQSVLYAVAYQWANKVSVSSESESLSFTGSTGNWRNDYLVPIVTFIFGFLLLEVIVQFAVYLTKKPEVTKNKK